MTITILLTVSDGTMSQDPILNTLQNLALALKGAQMMHATYIDLDHPMTMLVLAVVASNTKVAIVMPAFTHFSNCSFAAQEEALACRSVTSLNLEY
jgi:hypothetical protein